MFIIILVDIIIIIMLQTIQQVVIWSNAGVVFVYISKKVRISLHSVDSCLDAAHLVKFSLKIEKYVCRSLTAVLGCFSPKNKNAEGTTSFI